MPSTRGFFRELLCPNAGAHRPSKQRPAKFNADRTRPLNTLALCAIFKGTEQIFWPLLRMPVSPETFQTAKVLRKIRNHEKGIWAMRMRLRPFSKGRISKEIPPGPAMTPYFEVYASVPLAISLHFLNPQNMGSPPTHTVDAALPPASRAYGLEGEMGRGLSL